MSAAPTLEDARKVASLLVDDHGVGMVLLFGSVARGKANESSDIDLVAVFDDIDYDLRSDKQRDLQRIVGETLEADVDLLVTDRPEWLWRSQEMLTTFEAGISGDCVKLSESVIVGNVDWRKEIGLPMTEREEIQKRFEDCTDALVDVNDRIGLSNSEVASIRRGDTENENRNRYRRLRKTAAAASMGIETGLKVLVALSSKPPPSTHNASRLIRMLPSPLREEAEHVLSEELEPRVGLWRQAGAYSAAMIQMEVDEDSLAKETEQQIEAALQLAAIGIREYEKAYGADEFSNDLRGASADLHHNIKSIDLRTCATVVEQEPTFLQKYGSLRLRSKAGTQQSQQTLASVPKLTQPRCSHVGKRSHKQCVLNGGHAGNHRYR